MLETYAPAAVIVALGLTLAGCGASGGGGVASTPVVTTFAVAAPPSTPINTSFSGTLQSENFNNLSVHAAGTQTPTSVTNSSVTLPATNATVSYDATTKTYTLSTPDTSAAGQSPETTTALVRDATEASTAPSNGTTTGGYITRTGVAGANSNGFIYTYVSYANWHTEVPSGSNLAQTYNYAVFGATTPAASVPTSGTGSFLIDVDAQELAPPQASQGGRVPGQDVNGTGTATFNFASGTYAMNATIGTVVTYGALVPFSSSGTISSGSNGYSGTLTYNDAGAFSGKLGGWFFGPAAQELGAVFSASASDGRVLVGRVVGHH